MIFSLEVLNCGKTFFCFNLFSSLRNKENERAVRVMALVTEALCVPSMDSRCQYIRPRPDIEEIETDVKNTHYY